MSSKSHLTKRQIETLRAKFEDFKKDDKLTLVKIAHELCIDKTTVGKHFKKMFGEHYSKIAVKKCGWNRKLKDEEIKEIFLEYKNGTPMIELSIKYSVNRDALTHRMKKIVGREYSELAALRRTEDGGRKRAKVSNKKIRELFDIYRNSNYSLEELSEIVNIAESSLIYRFKRLFGNEYRKISIARRDERKVTKQEYERAFEIYRNTNISLTQLANKLDIKISSLAPRFRKMFGKEYYKIAKSKSDSIEINMKGKTAENLALEFLKLLDIKFEDVRNKSMLKGSLKRPDFLSENKFIEVKNNYIKMKGFGKLKGYVDIKNSYLNKEVIDGRILKSGMIISFCGFSPETFQIADEDGIELIGPEDIKFIFENKGRTDLVGKLKELRGL